METKTKICNECKAEKAFNDFHKSKTGRFGITAVCKICANKRSSAWRKKNKEKHNEYNKQWHKNNPIPGRKRAAIWAKENSNKSQRNKNKWYKKNKEYYRIRQEKRRQNPIYKLNCSMSSGISCSLKKGKGHKSWTKLVPYTLKQLKNHLERQFKPGMTWENYGKWHIDHKIPLSVHNFTQPDHIDFKRAWALKNLQPMWAKENMSKGAKLQKHFQPSLPF